MNKTNNVIKTGDELIIAISRIELDELDSSGITADVYKNIKNKKGIYEDIFLTVTVKSIELKKIKEIASLQKVKEVGTISNEKENDVDWENF